MIPSESVSTGGDLVAAVAKDQNGEPLGACIYLSVSELEALGINVDEVAEIEFSVDEESGTIVIEEVSD